MGWVWELGLAEIRIDITGNRIPGAHPISTLIQPKTEREFGVWLIDTAFVGIPSETRSEPAKRPIFIIPVVKRPRRAMLHGAEQALHLFQARQIVSLRQQLNNAHFVLRRKRRRRDPAGLDRCNLGVDCGGLGFECGNAIGAHSSFPVGVLTLRPAASILPATESRGGIGRSFAPSDRARAAAAKIASAVAFTCPGGSESVGAPIAAL
jgi:hypothetical protein